MRKLTVLVAGRARDTLEEIRGLLDGLRNCCVETRLVGNGHVDPLHGPGSPPQLLVLHHTAGGEELACIAKSAPEDRPELIVVGPGDDAAAVRIAMRAGARDYLPEPVDAGELRSAVALVAAETRSRQASEEGSMQVFMNGKGGSGASFLAANVAHGLAVSGHDVTLVDLDLQFAGLCRYLDLDPQRGIFEALQAVEELDEVSADAYTCAHGSGLRLLSPTSDRLRLSESIALDKLVSLLRFYRSISGFVIVDLPRHVDLLTSSVLENADRIMIVMQQSLPHLHDTARLLQILRHEMGLDSPRISVIVNRYAKGSDIDQSDIKKSLRVEELITIPNHFKLSAQSVNTGIPVAEVARTAAISRCLFELHQEIAGVPTEAGGLLGRALPGIFGRRRLRRQASEK